jgi:hypothetical protein
MPASTVWQQGYGSRAEAYREHALQSRNSSVERGGKTIWQRPFRSTAIASPPANEHRLIRRRNWLQNFHFALVRIVA